VTDAAKKLLDDALGLPPDDRARLASALIASLDESGGTAADSEWIEELERRAGRVHAGDSEGSPWPEVRARLLARLTSG
jgi:putative addiction module component (TIGR02574 family)